VVVVPSEWQEQASIKITREPLWTTANEKEKLGSKRRQLSMYPFA
jgi:hypothetical protein